MTAVFINCTWSIFWDRSSDFGFHGNIVSGLWHFPQLLYLKFSIPLWIFHIVDVNVLELTFPLQPTSPGSFAIAAKRLD